MIARWHCPSCAGSWWRLSLWPGRCRACGEALVREAPARPAPPAGPPPRRLDRLPGGPALRDGVTLWLTEMATGPMDWLRTYELELPSGERVGLGRREQLAGLIAPLTSAGAALEYARFLRGQAVPSLAQQAPVLVELAAQIHLGLALYAVDGLDPARPLVTTREIAPEGEWRRFEVVRYMLPVADLPGATTETRPLTSVLRLTETVRADGHYRVESRAAAGAAPGATGSSAYRDGAEDVSFGGVTVRLVGLAQRGRPLVARGRAVVAGLRGRAGWG